MKFLILEDDTILNMAHVAIIREAFLTVITIEMSRPKGESFDIRFKTAEARDAVLKALAELISGSTTAASIAALRARFAHLEFPREEAAACSTS